MLTCLVNVHNWRKIKNGSKQRMCTNAHVLIKYYLFIGLSGVLLKSK